MRVSPDPYLGGNAIRATGRSQFSEVKGVRNLLLLARPSSGAEGAFQAEFLDHLGCPFIVAVGAAPLDTVADGFQFTRSERLVDIFRPAGAAGKWPRAEQPLSLGVALMPSPKTAPLPCLGSVDQTCPQGIALHIAAEGDKMSFILHRERLESALVDVPRPCTMTMGMPPLCVGEGQPASEAGKILVFFGPDDQVPVIRQDAIGQQPHVDPLDRLMEDIFKGLVVAIFLKNSHPRIGAVEDMINNSAAGISSWSSHATNLREKGPTWQLKGS